MSASIVLRGGDVLVDDRWTRADLCVGDGLIADSAPADAREIDVTGLLVAPGLVDLQCNGAVGIDLRTEPERLWELASALPRFGTTAWLPTIVTSTPDVVARAQATLAAGPPDGWSGAMPLGLHLEGPFLSPSASGAHPIDLLRLPSLDAIASWTPAAGVAMVTIAPELDGALEVIEALAARGVVVSLGHSQATAAQVTAAADVGASAITHLFNAMSPLHHRQPGVAGTAMSDERLWVGLIADGIHVDPQVVGIAERVLGDRLVLVSDAVALLGLDDVDMTDGVRLPDGTLAGSVLPIVQAVRNLVAFTGCTPERGVAAASSRAAAVLGDSSRGTLVPGGRADLVVLDLDLDLHLTVVGGQIVHQR